jgi:hypothetical protein
VVIRRCSAVKSGRRPARATISPSKTTVLYLAAAARTEISGYAAVMSRPLRDQARIRSPATAMQARRPSHLTSATNSPASGSAATAVASMGAMKPGLSPAACPGIAVPRTCTGRGHARGDVSTVTGVLTWKYLP